MEIRTYNSSDSEGCLKVFDSNERRYFAEEERAQFEEFLRAPPGIYYVMDRDGELLGCGGFAPEAEPGVVSLRWGLIRGDLHRRGLGRFLLFYRLREIGKLAGVTQVRMETTQHTAGFFEKAGGFKVTQVEPGGYGPGLDRVTMVKRLSVCT